jgi:malonate-semialdehyde dehydrogenase (acetylating)/methylmalonate-semialdehyde dehydrogenase
MSTIGHLINGQIVNDENRAQPIFNPSTGDSTRQVALASKATVEKAIAAAEAAYPAWRATPPLKRARVMFRFKELLEQNADHIAQLIGEEHGKIQHDALGELQRGIENVEYACGAPELLKGEHSVNVGPGIDAWSEFQPLGVVAGITPFNFPAMVPLRMYPMAIVCGNCFILKPSERDPSSTLFIAQLLQEAGLPDGVMNVVNGDKEAVDTLLRDPRVQAVSFVGSTPIAEYIYTTTSAHGKRCQALGGAKNHAIVMPDADMDNTVNQLLGAAFGSSGERCMALSVAVAVGDAAADALVAKMAEAMKALKVGAYNVPSNDFGPVITAQHRDKIVGYIDSAEKQGARIVVDGRNQVVNGHENGFFVGGTLIDRVTPEMTSYQEEILDRCFRWCALKPCRKPWI